MDIQKGNRAVFLGTDVIPSYGHRFNFELTRQVVKNKRVLSVGCWTGQYEKLIAKECSELWGTDISLEPLVAARRLVPNMKIAATQVDHLPFRSDYFDVVVAWSVLEHVPSGVEPGMIRDVFRVLRPGGQFWLNTPSKNVGSILLDPAFWLGHRHYSEKALEHLLDNRFTVEGFFRSEGLFHAAYSILRSVIKYAFRTGFSVRRIDDFLLRRCARGGFLNVYLVARVIKPSVQDQRTPSAQTANRSRDSHEGKLI